MSPERASEDVDTFVLAAVLEGGFSKRTTSRPGLEVEGLEEFCEGALEDALENAFEGAAFEGVIEGTFEDASEGAFGSAFEGVRE